MRIINMMRNFHDIATKIRPEFSKRQGWGSISVAMLFEDVFSPYMTYKKIRVLEIGNYNGDTAFWGECFKQATVEVVRILEEDLDGMRKLEDYFDIIIHSTFTGNQEQWIAPLGASINVLRDGGMYFMASRFIDPLLRLERAKSDDKFPAYCMYPNEASALTDCLHSVRTFDIGDRCHKVLWFTKDTSIPEVDTVVFATTCAKNHVRADSCRDTWMPELNAKGYKTMLVIGNPEQKDKFELKDDVLSVKCSDAYVALPAKTKMITEYFVRHCDEPYMFKCDDDTYIRTNRFHTYDKRNRAYIGRSIEKPTHTYASGGAGYFLSKQAASIIAFSDMPDYGYEDWLVGKHLDGYNIRNYDEDGLLGGMWEWKDNKPTNMHYVNKMITQHLCRYPVEAMYNLHEVVKTL
jgi:hypothetical protein